jgi:hypothetical protein
MNKWDRDEHVEEMMDNSVKRMTLANKMQHYWHYYRTITILVLVVLFLVISLIRTVSLNKSKYDAYCLLLNDVNNTRLVNKIEEEFPVYLNNPKSLVNVNNSFPFNYLEDYGINWPDESAIVNIMSQDEDKAHLAISDYSTMLWAIHENYIYPLEEILPAEMLAVLKPYQEYANFKADKDNDGKIYGLNISDTAVFKGYSDKYENAVVFVPNLTVDPDIKLNHEMSIALIKYFFDMK